MPQREAVFPENYHALYEAHGYWMFFGGGFKGGGEIGEGSLPSAVAAEAAGQPRPQRRFQAGLM